MRLYIGSSALELHDLRWETLRDPESGELLSTSERVVLSRYVASVDHRPVRLRPRDRLGAVVIVASPPGLAAFRLAPIDVSAEVSRLGAALGGMDVEVLATGVSGRRATLDAIKDAASGRDVVVLVCHGKSSDRGPRLYLESDEGGVAVVAGSDFVSRFAELADPPKVVFLASCQSAGTGEDATSGDEGALSALGPRLAAAGIPAVIAMLGNVTMKTASAFASAFFERLAAEGQVDVAMAAARGKVRDRLAGDAWMPVLFSRLKDGRIWRHGSLGAAPGGEFRKWEGLVRGLAACTPVLGPSVSEEVLFSRRALARRWAEQYDYPLSRGRAEDLTEVAQYLAATQEAGFPRARLRDEIAHRMAEIAARGDAAHELLASLARLPFTVYVTANADDLLERALGAAGKHPRVDFCRWSPGLGALPGPLAAERGWRPTEQEPLVFHLFGVKEYEESLVVSEDDYLDYLADILAGDKESLPILVQGALTDRGLLLLGFPITDWSFRTVLRVLRSFGKGGRKSYVRAAVQIDLDDSPLDVDGARRYVGQYLQKEQLDIYFGSARAFVAELSRRHAAAGKKP